jgi:hypothetical protein
MTPVSFSSDTGLSNRVLALAHELDARLAAHPRLALALALGVGFAVGGGLSTRIGRMLLAAAARQGVKRLL